MFQVIEEHEDRKMRLVKTLAYLIAVVAMAAVGWFFAFVPYGKS